MVERVTDGLFTGVLLVVTLLAVPDGTPGVRVLRTGGVMVSLAFAALLAFLVLGYRNRALAVRSRRRSCGRFSPKTATRVAGMLDAFIHGLRLVPSRSKLALFFLLTAAYWAVNAWGIKLLARGFGFELHAVEAFTILGVLVVGVMIPAGPGMVGTFQGAIVLGLSLFAAREAVATRGVAFANVLWAVQMAHRSRSGSSSCSRGTSKSDDSSPPPRRWRRAWRRRRRSTRARRARAPARAACGGARRSRR